MTTQEELQKWKRDLGFGFLRGIFWVINPYTIVIYALFTHIQDQKAIVSSKVYDLDTKIFKYEANIEESEKNKVTYASLVAEVKDLKEKERLAVSEAMMEGCQRSARMGGATGTFYSYESTVYYCKRVTYFYLNETYGLNLTPDDIHDRLDPKFTSIINRDRRVYTDTVEEWMEVLKKELPKDHKSLLDEALRRRK
jgi:hypothetical protein